MVEDFEKQEEFEEQDKKDVGPLDPNYPLMKEFREIAPGSHKHAQSLAIMIENVCSAIDLDPTILKMAAMYHDIGKMWAPELFSENQGEENIHAELDPWVSYQLITRHVSDSVAILTMCNFPNDVIDIVSQHHGNCVLQAIYEQAKNKDPKTSEDLFRYKTKRPDSLESLILMLCDQVEATSRSLYRDQGRDVKPSIFISNLYNQLHLDGQFDNVSIKLGRLKRIQTALISDVASNFQKRVKYAEDEELAKEKE